MPSTKTLIQSPTISAVENDDLLWVWDSSASELNKISRTNLLTTTDDFNVSYARLAGRSGGQTLIGGTAANDDLTLEGTSNATRTTSYVILQPNGGNVGIGTASPNDHSGYSKALDINGPNGAAVYARTNNSLTNVTIFGNFGADGFIDNRGTGGSLRFLVNGGERITITSTGDVGIGTTSPSTRLDIDAGAIEFSEMTEPAAGGVNTGRLFCRDNGSGKTQLCIIFNTGAIQVIATQP